MEGYLPLDPSKRRRLFFYMLGVSLKITRRYVLLLYDDVHCITTALPKKEHPSKDYPGKDYSGKDYSSEDYPSKEYSGKDYPSKYYPSKDHPKETMVVIEVLPQVVVEEDQLRTKYQKDQEFLQARHLWSAPEALG